MTGANRTRMQRQPNDLGESRTVSPRPRRLTGASEPPSSRLSRSNQRMGQTTEPHVPSERRRLEKMPSSPLASRQRRDGRPEPNRSAKVPPKTAPFVYLVRLLIVGIGVGAIAGTTLSIWNPAMRSPSSATQAPASASQSAGQPNSVPGGNSAGISASIGSVRMGREMTDLVTKVTPMVNGLTDLVPGVFLMDLDNSNFFSFNGTNTFSAASMIKLPILVAFFQDVDAGKIKLDEMLVIQQTDLAEGSGDMQYAGTGTQYTALETATNMIIISDNTATNMIIRRIGGIETINQRFRQWGMQQTLMRKPLPDLEGTNTTSPKELVSLLALLNEGKLLSMKSRDRLFDIMRRTTTDTLLPSVMSPGSTAAHKTGDIGSMVGDVGIIDLPSGRRYAIAAMVKRPHNDGRAQDLIRQLAAVAYEQFGGQPVITPSPVVTPSPQVNPQQPLAPTLPGVPPSPTQQQPAPVYPTAPPAATDPNAVAPAPVAPAPVEPAPVEPTEPEAPIPDATDPNAVEPTLEEATGEQSDEQPQDVSLLSPEGWGASR